MWTLFAIFPALKAPKCTIQAILVLTFLHSFKRNKAALSVSAYYFEECILVLLLQIPWCTSWWRIPSCYRPPGRSWTGNTSTDTCSPRPTTPSTDNPSPRRCSSQVRCLFYCKLKMLLTYNSLFQMLSWRRRSTGGRPRRRGRAARPSPTPRSIRRPRRPAKRTKRANRATTAKRRRHTWYLEED